MEVVIPYGGMYARMTKLVTRWIVSARNSGPNEGGAYILGP